MAVLEGLVAFENLDEHEMYQGQSTGKFSLVLSLDEPTAGTLADLGVKLREYEGVKQRKFSTKYDVPVMDAWARKIGFYLKTLKIINFNEKS